MKKAYSVIKHIQKGDMDLIQGNAIQKAFTPEYHRELHKSLPQLGTALIQSKGALTNH